MTKTVSQFGGVTMSQEIIEATRWESIMELFERKLKSYDPAVQEIAKKKLMARLRLVQQANEAAWS